MKVKERTSHYVEHTKIDLKQQESIKNEICTRVKRKLDSKNQRQDTKRLLRVDEVYKTSKTAAEFKVPKANLKFHTEAAYAAAPIAKQSVIVEADIRTKAKELRKVIEKASIGRKIKIHPVNW